MKFIRQLDDGLAKLETLAIAVILSTMILLSFTQVILRNFFQEGILWADILLRQLVLWVGFLGASLAVRNHSHISIDFLPNFLPKSWGKTLRALVQIIAGGISIALAWAACRFIMFEREAESTLFLDIPIWFFQIILPYSFCAVSLRFLLYAFQSSLKES